MKVLILETPMMYGDHHVQEVRKLLLDLSGVTDVNASSAFQMVEVHYQETEVTPEAVRAVLAEAGYLDAVPMAAESGASATAGNGHKTYFRHSATLEAVGKGVSFAQKVPYAGRPLWPCPGMGVVKQEDSNG
jgi:copper chaperone CopZ